MAWKESASASEVHRDRRCPAPMRAAAFQQAALMIDSKLERRGFCVENGTPDLQKLAACFGDYNKITPESRRSGMKPTKLINNNYEGAHEHKGRCHTEAREPLDPM
jgi:hypothetical protein